MHVPRRAIRLHNSVVVGVNFFNEVFVNFVVDRG